MDEKKYKEITLLGKRVKNAIKKLEIFEKPQYVKNVIMETNEFTSLCPITGQPDYYHLKIEYCPKKKCLESKSLKLYLWTFRNQGNFCEELSQIITNDIYEALEPEFVVVTLTMIPRGGISITSRAEKHNGQTNQDR